MAKVLLVEDDNNLREIYEARLQAEGYEIVSASDGEQALVVAKNERPDLVISDVMMPKISGFEMLDILRNTDGLKDVKVIMLTALGQAEDKTRADQLGANRYLVKSQVTLEDIVKTAHQLLDDAPEPAEVPVPVAATPAPAPAPEPVAAPAAAVASTPAPAPAEPQAAASAAPTATDNTAETAEQEKADMAAQISSFEQQATPAAPAPAPAEPQAAASAAPAPAPEPVAAPVAAATDAADEDTADSQPTDAASNDQVMSEAIESLGGAPAKPSDVTAVEVPPEPAAAAPTDEAAAPPAPAPETADTTASNDDGVTIAHKKIIQPISDPDAAKPDIHDLLAAEQAKVAAQPDPVASVVAPTDSQSTEQVLPPLEEASVPPQPSEEVAAAPEPVADPPVAPAPPPAATTPPAAPPATPSAPQQPNNGPDPNSIAL